MFDIHLIYLIALTFVSAYFSGVVGVGGGILLLSLMTLFVPVEILIPLHSLLVVNSNASRAFVMRAYTNWPMVLKMSLSLGLGVAIGAYVNVNIPKEFFVFGLGITMLFVIWMPRNLKLPFTPSLSFLSVIHAVISTLFGAGGVLQAAFVRLSLDKHISVATFATALLTMNILKVTAFTLHGFPILTYLPVALICLPGVYLASLLGRKTLGKLPDETFKLIFKIVVSLLAVRLLISAF